MNYSMLSGEISIKIDYKHTHKQMNYISLILLLQNVDIDEKLRNAPDDRYQTGVIIGTYLPFVLLAGLAYLFYYLARKRKNNQ